MRDFHNLRVWQQAHKLTLALYRATASFPRSETYGLTSQIRRAAVSVPANLAEGCGRQGDAELARFCSIASGSASELEYHLLLARELNLLPLRSYTQIQIDLTQLRRMLNVLIQKLRTKSQRPRAKS